MTVRGRGLRSHLLLRLGSSPLVLTLRRLATSAETESVQLQAARALIQHAPGLVALVDMQPQFAQLATAVEE